MCLGEQILPIFHILLARTAMEGSAPEALVIPVALALQQLGAVGGPPVTHHQPTSASCSCARGAGTPRTPAVQQEATHLAIAMDPCICAEHGRMSPLAASQLTEQDLCR